ncbi:hypothetical protein [uncultured Clostridium sp.]|jgi:hypothetical protein|nr:hypothetical protein [uncultured Clostridium sp.]
MKKLDFDFNFDEPNNWKKFKSIVNIIAIVILATIFIVYLLFQLDI